MGFISMGVQQAGGSMKQTNSGELVTKVRGEQKQNRTTWFVCVGGWGGNPEISNLRKLLPPPPKAGGMKMVSFDPGSQSPYSKPGL